MLQVKILRIQINWLCFDVGRGPTSHTSTNVCNLTGRSYATIVDCSNNFGDTTTGAHTQAIECSWNVLKI